MAKDDFKATERRNYVRIDTEVPVRFKISWINPGKVYSATTKNISHGGICLQVLHEQDELVETLASPPEWPTIEVAPLLPYNYPKQISATAWITSRLNWIERPTADDPSLRIGLDFVDMAGEVRKQIFDLIVGQFIKNYNVVNISN
jgi:hypothetical protein